MRAALGKRLAALASPVEPTKERWLVFVHQLPAWPSNARVKTWRRLQQVGAVPVKNSVYVLPNSAQSREDFEWLRTEVVALGGQASLFEASSLNGVEDRQIIEQFRRARAEDFGRLSSAIKAMQTKRRQAFRHDEDGLRAVRALRLRYEHLRGHDFYSAPGGPETEAALIELDAGARRPPKRHPETASRRLDARDYRHRTWVTRPRPGVDRFSSAWLIRRFINPGAQFVFATSPEGAPEAVSFDMYQAGGFKHDGDLCTFEVLQERFGVDDASAREIGEIVHDLDLKDDRFRSPHAPTIGNLVDGLRASFSDDAELLAQGISLFEALYLSFQSAKPLRGGRASC